MTTPLLDVQGLAKRYRASGVDTLAVNDVSFSVAPGEVVGLLGPNGAGKTTTIKCVCGLVLPTSGEIRIAGHDVRHRRGAALERLAAVLEGNRNLWWRLSARENLELCAGLHGLFRHEVRERIDALLELFALRDVQRVQTQRLSRGIQQKLSVACALVKQTELLLLDEPTLGLDVGTAHEIRGFLRGLATEHGRTLLLSSHDMDLVQAVCDRVIIIHDGHVVTDEPIANLLALFSARAYAFKIAGQLGAGPERKLRERLELVEIDRDADATVVRAEFLDNRDFYDLVDILREANSRIESIARRDPNLEEIFLRIVREGHAA